MLPKRDNFITNHEKNEKMKILTEICRYVRCHYCGKGTDSDVTGTSKPMCERCYEHGGDDE